MGVCLMPLRKWLLTMFLVEANAGFALCDGLFYQLPEDGRWAMYSFDVSSTMDTREIRVKGSVRIASVGRMMVDNEACRWIEAQVVNLNMPGMNSPILESQSQTYKLLIPEKYLSQGGSPIDHVLRGWARLGPHGQHKPELVRNISVKSFDWFLFPIVLSGPLHNSRRLEQAEVDGKLGMISCAGLRGTLRVEKAGNQPAAECELENRLHSKSPFGVVTADYTIRESGDVPSRLHLELIAFGKNAISAMPEVK
jgi:hypothetical protein